MKRSRHPKKEVEEAIRNALNHARQLKRVVDNCAMCKRAAKADGEEE